MQATTTLQGLQQLPCIERVTYYRPGGFHPVHLNDTFKDGRYKVVHKLGYGAYGTVWLVHDTVSKRYASLKILAAEVSDSHSEVAVIQYLQQHATGSGKEYVVEVFDFFKHSGPNGIHQCMVMEVLGPPISSDTEVVYPREIFPIEVAKRISAQVAHGLAHIQKAGIVHGDLHMANVLLYSPVVASWSSLSDFEKYLGVPRQRSLRLWETNDLAPPSPHLPLYVVGTPNPDSLLQLCLSDPTQVHVKICDFGEAFIPAMQLNLPPRNTPVLYAAPEVIFGDPTGQPADIWALAVLVHTLTSSIGLFPSYPGLHEEVVRAMVWKLGKIPDRWWSSWKERAEWFSEDGKWVGDAKQTYSGFDQLIWRGQLSEAEIPAFEEIIKRMVRYDPGERASIDEVVEWMNQNAWFVSQ